MTPWKKRIFWFLLLSLPVILLLALEMLVRLLPFSPPDRHFEIGPFNLFSQVRIGNQPHYKISYSHAYAGRNVIFPVKKAPGTIRIFALGGSASAGWPHPPAETYTQYLENGLKESLTHNRVEVINVSAHGFASYRIRHIFDRVVDLEPDAILIYSGNNEFLEKRSYDTSNLNRSLKRLGEKIRLVALAERFTSRALLSGQKLEGLADIFWKKVKKESLRLRSDPEQLAQVKEHYRSSIEYIAAEAEKREVPMILMTVPVNLRDWFPNVSHNPLMGAMRQQFTQLLQRAQREYLEKRYHSAATTIDQALKLNFEHADSHFWKGRILEATGDYKSALESYRQAKDLDYNPFRALSAFNNSLREIAGNDDDKIFLVDLEQVFTAEALRGIPGFDLFLDYVHPTQPGNHLIAATIQAKLFEKGIISGPENFRSYDLDRAARIEPGGYDEKLDFNLQSIMFNLATMNHQYEAVIRIGGHLQSLVKNRSLLKNGLSIPQTLPQRVAEGLRTFELYQDIWRRERLGLPVTAEEREYSRQLYQNFYERYHPYGVF